MTGPGGRGTIDEAGFTLVEVLVAFTIIALTLTVAMRLLAEGAGWARRGPAMAAHVEEAVSVMNRFVADPQLVPGDTDGTFADGAPWRVQARDVTALIAPHGNERLTRIELFLGPANGHPLFVTVASGTVR